MKIFWETLKCFFFAVASAVFLADIQKRKRGVKKSFTLVVEVSEFGFIAWH